MGGIVFLALLLCFFILVMLAAMFGRHDDFVGVLFIFCIFVAPLYAVLKESIKEEKEKKERRLLEQQNQLKQLQRQREEEARLKWEQTAEGQAFLTQQRREADEKERIEAERRKKEAEELVRVQKEQAERAARKNWRKWHESKTVSEIAEMSGLEFEEFLYRLLAKMGFINLQLTPINDQGGDLVGDSPEGIRTVVQAKRWKNTLGNAVVQELLGAMLHYDAVAGMVITNSTFTEAACQLAAKDRRITLCDGRWLETQIRKFLPPEIPEFDWTAYNAIVARDKITNHRR